MAVPAPILPPTPDELELPASIRESFRASWAAWWGPFLEDVRKAPPEADSEAERAVLARFALGPVALTARYGDVIEPLLRQGFAQALDDLVMQEGANTATERRLGLKYLERAVEVLAALFEAAQIARSWGPALDALSQLARVAEAHLAQQLDAPAIALLRLEMSVFVAFDLAREEDTGAFVLWARHARAAASRAAPYVAVAGQLASAERATEISADIALPAADFERVVELTDKPPAPSPRLCKLMGRGRS